MVVLLLLCVASLLASGAATVHWILTRLDARGRVRDFPMISVGLGLTASLLCMVPVQQHARLEERLSAAATRLVGAHVVVHCQSFGETWTDAGAELGFVRWGNDGVPEHRTVIKYDQCNDLSAWLDHHGRHASRDQVIAVHVLTHESMHMAGQTDEARAECAAVQRDRTTARLLGASDGDARDLALRYWHEVYPWMPDGYRSDECRSGGSLDEHLDSAPWGS